WAVLAGINPGRARTTFETALRILEKDEVILLGWPPLREDSKPYLGRSSVYPEGVRENGMYCHGVQWLARGARGLSRPCTRAGGRAHGGGKSGGGPPLPRHRASALDEDIAAPPYPRRDHRDVRGAAEQAGRRPGDDVRPGPHDLERLHRGRGLDAPAGRGGGP